MRIALFGGSFNPIHVGHIAIADAILQQKLAEEVWLMVSPHNPLKESNILQPEELRLRWAQIATEGHPGIMASDYEFHLERPSYTYQTLRHLRQERPQDEFILCIGGDNWRDFSLWREPEEIKAHHRIIVYPRPGDDIDATAINQTERVTLLQAPLMDVSSTEIRRRLSQHESLEGLVPPTLLPTIEQEWKNYSH